MWGESMEARLRRQRCLLGSCFRGNSVQFRRDPQDVSQSPIGKVQYSFKHTENFTPGADPAKGPTMTWLSNLQYESLGVGTAPRSYNATDMAKFVLQNTVDVFPAAEI